MIPPNNSVELTRMNRIKGIPLFFQENRIYFIVLIVSERFKIYMDISDKAPRHDS